jgi:hypothetical protein
MIMKKILTLLMVASLFSLVACEPSEEEQAEATETLKIMLDDMEEATEEKSEHVCDAKCKEDGCTGSKCGEKGHKCTGNCHANTEEEHSCGESCNAGTHKCGEHCGCGDGCKCSEGATCSAKCDMKTAEETTEK